MATTAPAATTTDRKRVRMDPLRRTSLVAGGFYLLSFVSIPTLWLYGPAQRRTSPPVSAPTVAFCWPHSSRSSSPSPASAQQ